jgi:hypothetical protein
VGEWVALIEACEDARVLIYVTSHGKTYDPADERDRRSLLEDAVDSEWESAKLSKRLRRSVASRAEEGRPHGRAPYGYRHVFDPATGALSARVPEPAEAAVVAELFTRLHQGETLKAIAREFGARGIVTRGTSKRAPQPFRPEYLRTMALTASYAGLRTHQPGRTHRKGALEGAVPAAWPAIVDAETFHAVHAMLNDPARRTSRPGRAVHDLSLIARCGACGGPLTVSYRSAANRVREYFCREKSCVRVSADELDSYARDVVLAYLGRQENYAQLTAAPDAGPELDKVRAELAQARAELADWRRRAGRREVSAESFAAIEPAIAAGITALEQRDRELSTPAPLAWLLAPGEDLAARWKDAPVSAHRDAYRLLCSPRYLGYLSVCRSKVPRHRLPVGQRVRWDRAA